MFSITCSSMAGHSNNNKYVLTDQEANYFSFVYNRNAQKHFIVILI